ncbi:MAG TPA: polysaccharide pyruvyl transferase CsaB [Fimbriimonadaceae bacterium]|nr:polysaccharide pyruvyl transferase CsaB [Fimbriimonadaceae bacterium]
MHLLLAGYFGCGNLGDDAILLGFIHGLGAGYDLSVLSGAPEETYRLYGLRSIPRKEMASVQKAISECDALVFPGGSIFQDSTSFRSVVYYQQLVRMAKKAGKRVLLLGQGVGPLNGFLAKRAAAGAFNSADVIAVRDPGSLSTLKSLGVQKRVDVTADCAFLLPAPRDLGGSDTFQVGSMRSIGIAPRPLEKRKEREIVKLFADLSRMLFTANFMPVLIEMDRNVDGALIDEISKLQGGKVPSIKKLQTPMNLQQRISRMDSVIGVRLHAGIIAASVGVPSFMISYDPKVAAFAKLMDLGTAPQIEGLNAQRLFDAFVAFQKDRERNQRIVQKKQAELAVLAAKNIELLRESLTSASKI